MAAAAPLFEARTALAQTPDALPISDLSHVDQQHISDFGNWRVVSILNNSIAFVIPERSVNNHAETADKSEFGSAELKLEYWSQNGGAYSATLTIDFTYDPSNPDRRHAVSVYLDDALAGSFEATAGAKKDALALLGGREALTGAHALRVEMQVGDETLTILDLDMTGIAEAVPAMRTIPDYTYSLGIGEPTEPDPKNPGCFITTACCELIGLPDDCWELRTLRRFRDEVMLPTAEGRADVARYYQLAPAILGAIHERRDERRLLGIYACFILPSAVAAALGLRGLARWLYGAMMTELVRRFL
jgi:hypothetical protein